MKKVLIADDEATLRFLLSETLKLSDEYEVFEAVDGEDVLDKYSKINPDLMILDIMMPKLSGYEVVERLKETSSSLPKIIFLTAKVQKNDIQKGLDLGVDHYLMKPFSPMQLIEIVNKTIEK